LSCKKIERTDGGGLGASDPFIEIRCWDGGQVFGQLIWRTEVRMDSLNCDWKPFPVFLEYLGGNIKQQVILQLFDYARNGHFKEIGQFACTFEDLVLKQNQKWHFINPQKKSNRLYKHSGQLLVKEAKPILSNEYIFPELATRYIITLSADDLVSYFGDKTDPFLVIKLVDDRDPDNIKYRTVAKTEMIENKKNVTWVPLTIEARICPFHVRLILEVWDHNPRCRHKIIGRTRDTSLHELRMSEPLLPLINPLKVKEVGYMNSGTVRVRDFKTSVEQIVEPKHYRFKFGATFLMQKDFSSLSDPYFTVHAYPLPKVSCFNPSIVDQSKLYASFGQHYPPQQTWQSSNNTKMILYNIIPPTINNVLHIPDKYKPKIYQSEVVTNNQNPEWHDFELHVDDCGGYYNEITIKVIDYDRDGTNTEIGQFTTTLSELICLNAHFKLKKKGKKVQQGLVHVKEVTPVNVTLDKFHLSMSFNVKFKARRVEKLDGLQASDAFLKFFAIPFNQTEYIPIGNTEEISGSTEPEWSPFTFALERITSVDNPIMIECWDKDKKNEDDFIGVCFLSLREMKCMQQKEAGVMLINKKKQKNLGYKNSGVLEVVFVQVNQ
jgi:hypothetical protein